MFDHLLSFLDSLLHHHTTGQFPTSHAHVVPSETSDKNSTEVEKTDSSQYSNLAPENSSENSSKNFSENLDPILSKKPSLRIDLKNNYQSQYYGEFFVGNPPQKFTGIFDTGSGLLWVPGQHCHDQACQNHRRFDQDLSSSFHLQRVKNGQPVDILDDPVKEEYAKFLGTKDVTSFEKLDAEDQKDLPPLHITYGTGRVDFDVGRDTINLCDKDDTKCISTSDHQTLGISKHQSPHPFSRLPFDGIIGLSRTKHSMWTDLKEQDKIKEGDRNFSFYLSADTKLPGSFVISGTEPEHIDPADNVHWHGVDAKKNWILDLVDIEVDGKRIGACPKEGCNALVDTGTSNLTGPKGWIDKLQDAVPVDKECRNYDDLKNINLLIREGDDIVRYPLEKSDYLLEGVDSNKNRVICKPSFSQLDMPSQDGRPTWVVGDTFLRRYYSIFDDDNSRVGFIRSRHEGDEDLIQRNRLDLLPQRVALDDLEKVD